MLNYPPSEALGHFSVEAEDNGFCQLCSCKVTMHWKDIAQVGEKSGYDRLVYLFSYFVAK